MTGNGVNARPPTASNGGEFLLSLLQKPHNYFPDQYHQTTPSPSQQHQHQQVHDPAVAAMGPSLPIPPSSLLPSNGPDLPSHHLWSTHSLFPPPDGALLGLSQNPVSLPSSQLPSGNQIGNDIRRLGFSTGVNNVTLNNLVDKNHQLEHKLQFGSLPSRIEISRSEGFPNSSTTPLDTSRFNKGFIDRNYRPNLDMSRHGNFDSLERERRGGEEKQYRRTTPPPGFTSKPRGGENWDSGNRRKGSSSNADREMSDYGALISNANNVRTQLDRVPRLGLSAQLDRPVPPLESNLLSVSVSDIEEQMMSLGTGFGRDRHEVEGSRERVDESSNVEAESDTKSESKQHKISREKDSRSDTRGRWLLSQRDRIFKRQMQCRSDIDRLNAPFLAIFQSLIPPEEEKAKQKQLLALLERLVTNEWPKARLYLYGSCANSFGVSRSDIDLCLAIQDVELNKSDVILKLADILQSDNLQNVQALTRARVPIVKLMDPVTGISCDICINNVLAVVNTKLLRDYAQIDVRLQQLTFIVKHWAKSRGVNATYQGTLSSYAYVLMCIHFLQMRRPAILPCLQRMKATYSVIVDNIQCAYFDQVEQLRDFGCHNKESIAQLVSGFFNYWAYCHDYTDSVISVRTGSIISKRDKDWTRRIGNDRHLICIEDPFETSHDLGRVVDKYSIRVLREEFERAAEIMQYDPNPCMKLFELYVPISI